MGKVFKVALVEGSPLYREGVKLALNHIYGQFQFIEVTTLASFGLLLAYEKGLDLVIIDISVVSSAGYEESSSFIGRSVPPVLMTCHEIKPEYQNFIRSSGLKGVIEKKASVGEFNKAVIAVLTGGCRFPDYMQDEAPSIHQKVSLLTRRESEIFELLIGGMMNKQIAYQIGITEHTVKSHVSRILNKLGVSSRMDLVVSMHQEQTRSEIADYCRY